MSLDITRRSELTPLSDAEKKACAKSSMETSSEAIMPVPLKTKGPNTKHPKYGKPKDTYEYMDAKGRLLFITARYEYSSSDNKRQKAVLPISYWRDDTNGMSWHFKMPTGQRPMFGLHDLAQNKSADVIIVEGEKAAEAARSHCEDYVWVTSSGGAFSADKTDWLPLAGRNVVIWPDNDSAGLHYQRTVCNLICKAGAESVVFLRLPKDTSKGWDVADAIADGWSAKRITRFITKHRKAAKLLPTLSMEELHQHTIVERKRYFPWLAEGSLCIVVAKAGLGKTMFSLGAATALANGNGFLKWENPLDPVGVLYIDGEMALHDMRERLRGFLPEMKTEAPLELLSHQEFWDVEESDMNLVEEAFQARIKSYIDSRPDIRAVVIDNLSCLFPTMREDKRDDWVTVALPLMIWFRRRNIAVIMVHHTNKTGDQRGSAAKLDAVDVHINLSPLPNSGEGEQAGFYVTFPKSRSAWGDDVAPIEAKLMADAKGKFQWEWRSREESNEDKLISLIKEGIERVKDAADMMGITEGAISKIKKKLIEKGTLADTHKLRLRNTDADE